MTAAKPAKIAPAGEHPSQRYAVYDGPMPRSHTMTDTPDKTRAKRRCARCGKRFQPTVKRLMLCAGCFTSVDASGMDG